jgi:hypothetical protein
MELDKIDFNAIFERADIVNRMKKLLREFNDNRNDLSIKRGLYVYGSPGCGKTEFVTRILKDMAYDVVQYDAGDVRNKNVIDAVTKHNMSDQSVMSIFGKAPKRIAIIMDEVDGMNTGDKGGITSLIKLIRPKKTKKQKSEDYTMNPIVCIGNYDIDKKIKEIMKVCHVIELPAPTLCQMKSLVGEAMPEIPFKLAEKIAKFTQCDVRKFMLVYEMYAKDASIITEETLDTIFKPKTFSESSKIIVNKLFNTRYAISQHTSVISETDRTIVGLLWHENVVDRIFKSSQNMYTKKGGQFYERILKNICFADYIDRITFQKQIWIFNEMSSLIKTFYNNDLYNDYVESETAASSSSHASLDSIRFTKVLTKYSTEYNNILFIQHMCNEMLMDKKNLIEFFNQIKCNKDDDAANACCEQHSISYLDVDRMFRYIDKCFSDKPVQFVVKSPNVAVDMDVMDANMTMMGMGIGMGMGDHCHTMLENGLSDLVNMDDTGDDDFEEADTKSVGVGGSKPKSKGALNKTNTNKPTSKNKTKNNKTLPK